MTPNAARTSSVPPSDIEFVSLPVAVLSQGDRRFEGESYLTGGYAVRLQIENGRAKLAAVKDLAAVWQPGRLRGIGVAPREGIPYLTATQMFDIRPSPRKWLAPARTSELPKRYVEAGWILLTRSGHVGDAIVAYMPHLKAIISDDLLRVVVKGEGQRGYLYAYLRTGYGQAMLRASQYGSIIKHLEPEHVENMPVVLAPEPLRAEISERIEEVYRLRDEAFALARAAELRFEEALDLSIGDPGSEIAYSVSSESLFQRRRRLDAYHYNPLARAILLAMHARHREVDSLRSVAERIILPQRFQRNSSPEHGTPYLDSEDIFKIQPEIAKFIPNAVKSNLEDYFVKRDWILVARSGQIYGLNGSCMLATTWHENKVVSEHIIRVVPRRASIRPGYLAMALGHPSFGRPLVLRLSFGTEVPEIAPEDLADFPVVRLGTAAEDAIADAVERASELRRQANEAEDQAVHVVAQHVEAALGENAAHVRLRPAPRLAEEELP